MYLDWVLSSIDSDAMNECNIVHRKTFNSLPNYSTNFPDRLIYSVLTSLLLVKDLKQNVERVTKLVYSLSREVKGHEADIFPIKGGQRRK